MDILNKLLFIVLLCFAPIVFSHPGNATHDWLEQTTEFSLNKILDNISPTDALPGAVIAAKSRRDPNYYYHWVRDAGLAIDALETIYENTQDQNKKKRINQKLTDYLNFSHRIQHTDSLTGLGEPKFNVDGTAFNEPWGRPQNDSPALRAISLIHWANLLIDEGKTYYVKTNMYTPDLPADSPIKMDLEYISHHWREPCYDLWEEVKGMHFYTLMVQRRALLEGAKLAHQLHDEAAADWYYKQGKEIEKVIQQFWNPKQNLIMATFNRVDGIDYKFSNLDSAVILGLLHGNMHDGFFPLNDARVMATMQKLIKAFTQLYPINQGNAPGIAIGRYPEDRYSGSNFSGGNPWPLITLAFAEALYEASQLEHAKGNYQESIKLAQQADTFIERVRYHANHDGSLNEQIDRNTGYMTSVNDLTWNYAALVTVRQAMINN